MVDRKLAGACGEVTEVLIGQRVFERPPTYNPGEDSIVRTEARSLRQRLGRYFETEGASEPVILEIPRGGYTPVFRPRHEAAPAGPVVERQPEQAAPGMSRRLWLGIGASAVGLSGLGFWIWKKPSPASGSAPLGSPRPADLHLEAADARLSLAFQRAKERALASVFTGDPVGEWYASNRDNRAFCMRDTAHECAGAALLGLFPHSLNMLRRFAASISRSRRWCGYWIITKDGFPSPFEYSSDGNFAYALPANFDLLRACYRQLLWTGDRQYLDPVFTTFYECTVTRYVNEWDSRQDGMMEARADQPRVTASYHNQAPRFLTGADLVAAQYAGYLDYAGIQEIKGGRGSLSHQIAEEYRAKAGALRRRFNTEWWDDKANRFRSGMLPDRSWSLDFVGPCQVYPLKFGIPEEGVKTEAALDFMEQNRPAFDSTYSYYPEVLYRYDRSEQAHRLLLAITDPAFSGYRMAETAFAAIASIGLGLMGLDPDASQSSVRTMPRLPRDLEWVRMTNIPVAANLIAVEHRGLAETHFTNQAGEPLTWKAAFPAPATGNPRIVIDGSEANLTLEPRAGRPPVAVSAVSVKAGQRRVARMIV